MRKVPTVKEYKDSAVVIAGGSSGIGLASALGFVDAGVRRLALLSLDPDRGEAARRAVEEHSGGAASVIHVPVDANDPGQVQTAIEASYREHGTIDVLVNSISAPAYRPELLHRTPIEEIPKILAAQAVPPMLLTRAALPLMQGQHGGSVINVASDAAKIATPGESVLGGAMAAIVMFTRAAAVEAKRNGVRVNVITPSLISGTPTTKRALEGGLSKKIFDKAAELAHLGVPEASDQASLVVFLGGPGSARLTGQAISVTGGIAAA